MSSTLRKSPQTLPWNKSIELPNHHQWKHANQSALLEWKIKARPYNTTIANGMFAFMLCVTLIFSYFLLYKNAKFTLFETFFIAAPGFFLFFLALYGTTHQKTKFAYRLTETGIEVCEWKAPGKGWMIALKWLTVIAAIAVLFVVALDPSAFWIALAGPGGMGFLYLGLANSKQFQEIHSLYRHNVFTWDEIKHIYIDKSRHLISLEYEWLNENINKTLPWWTYVFCDKKDFDHILNAILSKNPSIPHTREKVEVLQF
ncbi:hypothetical protein [Stutzerimonas zhaodongensis]|uniref:Uncharacterized protein n=1 Tax=Stutzerimonas zhaodongensis TaxID=1176257 RepID=A0A365PQ48_9GAMM|nr:hypothetical protein [Stutzerimonas zhaodongensis]QWV18418.1 hypothetical protein KQ248_07045 [Stutzerimonas zhaodongensis]RBA53230.1 hypothetical protein DQ403_19875 [Stutzerimonas zhaodongensis]